MIHFKKFIWTDLSIFLFQHDDVFEMYPEAGLKEDVEEQLRRYQYDPEVNYYMLNNPERYGLAKKSES